MAFDFPDTTNLPSGSRVINPKTGTEYSWNASADKWVAVNPGVVGDYVEKKGDVMSGPLLMTNGSQTNPLPIQITVDEQAIHKAYLDERIEEFLPDLTDDNPQLNTLDDRYVNVTGDVMTGDLETPNAVIPGDITFTDGSKLLSDTSEIITFGGTGAFYKGTITQDNHLINKGYVDDAIEEAVDELKDGVSDDYYNTLIWVEPNPAINTMPLLNKEQPHTWTGAGGQPSELYFDIKAKEPYHIGFRAPNDLSPYNQDLALKFTHDSGVMYARIAASWYNNGIHINLKDVTGDILVDGEQTSSIEVQDSIFVERAGDSMTGHLVMDNAMIEFQNRVANGTLINANRPAGEDVTLLRLENSASGSSSNFYNILMGGNTFYNGMQIKGGSGAHELFWQIRAGSGEMKFFSDVSFQGKTVQNVGNAVKDTDAVPYGQIKSELQEKFDEYVDALTFGTYTYTITSNPLQGFFAAYTAGGSSTEHTPADIRQLWINEKNKAGDEIGLGSLSPGDLIRLVKGTELYQFRVNGTPVDQGSWLKIDVNKGTGPADFSINDEFEITLVKLTGGSVNLDEYLKLDTSNGPLTGNLGIDVSAKGTGNEAQLTLKGNRTGATNAVATIIFDNESQASATPGYLTYRSSQNSSDGEWFKFNKDVDFSNQGLHSVAYLSPSNETSKKIVLRNPTSDSNGDCAVEIQRAADNRRSFSLRGKDADGNMIDMFSTYMNSGGPDAVNYTGKMDGETNILNRKAILELVGGGGFGETFIQHGAWHYAGPGATVSPGEFTTDVRAPKQIRQLTFHNKNREGEDVEWSDLVVGETITIVQQGDYSGSSGGGTNDWLVINYEVKEVHIFGTATIIDVSAHWSIVVFSNGYVEYNPSDTFGFLTDTDTYALESQPATLNNVVQMAKKTSAGPAFNVYRLANGTSEPLVGISTGTMINSGNQQTPTKFIFAAQDKYGNGHKWGPNSINCPNSIIELYRKNADGTLCLCKVYSFTDIIPFGTNKKFEVRGLVQKFTASSGNGFIFSPGNYEVGADYLVRWKFSFGTTTAEADLPYTVDEEGDTHWDGHRIEEISDPVDPQDAATKAYVDELAGGSSDFSKFGTFTWRGVTGGMPIGGWEFEGRIDPDYQYDGLTQINIAKVDKAGNPWTADDFPIGERMRIINKSNDHQLVAQIQNVVDGGPSSLKITYSRISALGNASGDQTVIVGSDPAVARSLGLTSLITRLENIEKRLNDAGL